jgi:adenosine kinase
MVKEGILFAIGNPLLDISAEVTAEFLKKYGLEPNNAILAEDKHKGMYDDMVTNFKVEYVPGGATLNTVRTAQWIMGIPRSVSFVGCIGKDKYGQILEDMANRAGVATHFQYNETENTGTCAVLLTGMNRSLCAYLGAANHLSVDHLRKPEVQALMEKAQFYYMSGFPLTVTPEGMLEVAKFACERNRLFCMNLSAPFLCTVFKEQMMKVLPYVDILFGNESEAEAFSNEHGWNTKDMKVIAEKLAQLPKQNGARARVVVLTHGALPTVVYRNGEVKEYDIVHIKQEDIVDTNGAGDAFVGGFMAELVQGACIDTCIRCANYAANFIIQRSGCTLPERNTYSEHKIAF